MMKTHRQRYMMLGALVAALVLTGVVGTRALHAVRHFHRGNAEEIRPWMPIPYIARSHDVPPHILLDSLGMKLDDPGSRVPIDAIARQQNLPIDEVIRRLNVAIQEFHAKPPPPPPTPGPPPTPVAERGQQAGA